jgi:diguanylate cyclase (GGDEF)-like protein/PAS domain S-box-containing protein
LAGGDAWAGAAEERRLRALLEYASDVLVVLDAAGHLIFDLPQTILGYRDTELRGRNAIDLVHVDDRDRMADWLGAILSRPGAVGETECRVLHADGSWRSMHIRAANRLDDDAVRGVVVNALDVTREREAEAIALQSDARLRSLVRNATDLTVVCDPRGVPRYATPSLQRILGLTLEEIGGDDERFHSEFVHEDDLPALVTAFEEARAEQGTAAPIEFRARRTDGSWRVLDGTITHLLDDPAVAGIVINVRDVTDRKQAENQLRDQTRFVETLHGVGKTLAAELDLDKLVQAVTDAAVDVSSATFGVFVGGEEVAVTASSGARPDDHRFPDDTLTRVLQGEGPVRSAEVLAVPVTSRRGEVLGALLCGGPEGDRFTERGERMLLGIAGHAGVALDNARLYHAAQIEISARKQAEAELAHAATHDPLTGLPNRALFLDRLAMAVGRSARHTGATGVLLFDLDRFKVVNDSLGHSAGDELLVQVAARLELIVRPGDTVARMGGDEFIMVCENLNGEIDAIGIADRVAETLSAPFSLTEAEVSVSASVGIAVAAGPGHSPAALVRDADAAMYRAKERGRNRWELFDEGLRTRAVQRLSLETDLRHAIEREELRLHFQPIMAVPTGSIVGVEALVRWERAGVGLAPPADFIRVAEETGLVVGVGEWVLAETCRQISAGLFDGVTVSINVSARQLQQRDMLRTIQRALSSSGIDPHRLCIEITESVLMEDVASAVAVLEELRSLGIKLWVDDFGTGYSSLAYLRRLPIDGLKIDRSFVAGLAKGAEDLAIATGVVSLAHSLGLVALAEGVETDEQLALLKGLGCDLAQGFHWTPPLAPTDLRTWMAAV